MNKRDKIGLTVIAILAVLAFSFYSMWRSTSKALDVCAYASEFNRRDALNANARVGELETALEQWKARPPEVVTLPGSTVYRDRFKSLPADCRVCAENWTLDRTYANPGPKPPKGTIEVSIRDVLGDDEATWRVNTGEICPESTPCPPPPASPRIGFRADVGLGYGVAGPEAGAAVWPLVFASPKAEVAVGAWAHANLTDQGAVQGNAVLGVRVTRTGAW